MEKRNWKRSVTLKQRMVLCLAAFFAAFGSTSSVKGTCSGAGVCAFGYVSGTKVSVWEVS